jgi:hypothetical protein
VIVRSAAVVVHIVIVWVGLELFVVQVSCSGGGEGETKRVGRARALLYYVSFVLFILFMSASLQAGVIFLKPTI